MSDVFPFHCNECGEGKKTSQALASHIRTQHPAVWAASKKPRCETPGSAIATLLLDEDAGPDFYDDVPEPDQEVGSASSSDCQVVAERGQKLTKGGRPKLTRGRPRRQTVTASVKLKAIAAHLATKEMGHPVVDDFNRACGTSFSYNSVYNWTRKKAELEKLAVKENKSKLSKQKKGWFRGNPLVKKFNHQFQKTLRKARRAARNLTTNVALAIARRVHERLENKHPDLQWPLVRKTGQRWKPSGRWIRSWFHCRGWKPRKATKKRSLTPAQDSAAMQKFLDKLRYVLQQQPPTTEGASDSEAAAFDPSWGFYDARRRFNRDQIGLQFDFSGEPRTWCAPEERTGCVAVTTGPPKWSKRYCTWDMTYSADLTGPQPPAVLYFPGKGRVSDVEKLSYHPDTRIIWTPKGYLNSEANEAWCNMWTSWKRENLDAPVVLTLDNVACQRKRSFQRRLLRTGTTVVHGEPNATHVWQAIDRHIGRMQKKMLADTQLDYLSDRDNFRGFSKLSASDRRILLSHWVGAVREQYIQEKVQQHLACCAAAGLRIRLDGVGDDKVSVESNPVFHVQPFVEWEGLVQAIDRQWVEDEDEDVEIVESPVPSSSSSSSSDSSSDAASSDAAASAVAASSESEVSVEGEDGANYVSAADLRLLLQSAVNKGKADAGMKMLASFAKNKTALSHPKRLQGKFILHRSLKEAAEGLQLALPALADV